MNIKPTCAYLSLCSCFVVLLPCPGSAQVSSSRATPSDQNVPTARDGQHDFDFELGAWTIHLKRLMHPLSGSTTFYAMGTLNSKPIIVWFVWSNTTTNSPHFEQAFSDDGGKTWEVNWVTDQTRVKGDSATAR